MSPARGMEDWALELFCAGDGAFIRNCEAADCEDQDVDVLGPLGACEAVFQGQGPGIGVFVPSCGGEGRVEDDVGSDAVLVAHGMQIRPDLFLRGEECTARMRVEGEGVKDPRDVTCTTGIGVDVPGPSERRFLLVDGKVRMIELAFELNCLT